MTSPVSFKRPKDFDTSQYLYQYRNCNDALKYILCEDGKLLLNQMKNVNDPRESKFKGFAIYGGEFEDDTDPNYIFRDISEHFTSCVKIACFSKDDNRISTPPYSTPEPFLRGYAKPKMWATYGDNHKGVCLVFSKNKLIKNLANLALPSERFYCDDVGYDRFIETGNTKMWSTLMPEGAFSFMGEKLNQNFHSYMLEQIENHYIRYFFWKHEDWRSEDEYRLVLYGGREEVAYLPCHNAIEAIAVGMECSEDNLKALIEVANRIKIPIVQPEWSLQGWSQKQHNEIARQH